MNRTLSKPLWGLRNTSTPSTAIFIRFANNKFRKEVVWPVKTETNRLPATLTTPNQMEDMSNYRLLQEPNNVGPSGAIQLCVVSRCLEVSQS